MSDNVDVTPQDPYVKAEAGSDPDSISPMVTTTSLTGHSGSEEPVFKKSVVREYFESGVVTLIMALFGMTFIVQAVKVPTGSMKNAIWIQDHLLVNKFIFGPHERLKLPIFPSREIRRGDIIVFKYPKDPQTNYVKRVIALPGETVEFESQKNRVYINGEELPEQRVFVTPDLNDSSPLEEKDREPAPAGAKWAAYYYEGREERAYTLYHEEQLKYGVYQPFRVPMKGDPIQDEIKSDPQLRETYDADGDGRYDSDQYFCMGDNRDNSQDSRFWGTVPRNNIVGHAMFVYWSYDKDKKDDGSSNPLVNFFTKSRWSRTGRFIK
jgi:signal peptidase I